MKFSMIFICTFLFIVGVLQSIVNAVSYNWMDDIHPLTSDAIDCGEDGAACGFFTVALFWKTLQTSQSSCAKHICRY